MISFEKETVKTPFGQDTTTIRSVQFKGRPGALELQLNEDDALLTILSELKLLLEQNQTLLGKTSLSLNFGERPIDALQYNEVRRVIERYGHKITKLQVSPAGLESYLEGEFGLPVQLEIPSPIIEEPVKEKPAQAAPTQISPPPTMTGHHPPVPCTPANGNTQSYIGAPTQMQSPVNPIPRVDTPSPGTPQATVPGRLPEFDTRPESTSGQATRPGLVATGDIPTKGNRILHKVLRTCRAGTLIDVDGDVVLFGDLNQGAEIRATGDIIVFGSLRGMAHAGCEGDTDAIIAAYDLSPTQLRLSGRIAIAPSEELRPRSKKTPIEIAYLNTQKQIEVEACVSGKFPPIIRQLSL